MAHRDRVALDVADAHRGGVEQDVDEVVGQQVDLVDVEHAAVRARQQPGLEGALAGQRAAEVQRAHEAVDRRADRQLDERRRALLHDGVRLHHPSGARSPGAKQNGRPAAAGTAGSSGASARTAVDFAVPRSPRTSTPPTSGETALTSSASRSASWPTIAERIAGYATARACTADADRLLQLALELEVALADRAHRLVGRLRPQPAVGRLQQPLGDRPRRPRVRAAHERADVGVEQVLARDVLVHPVLRDAGRRVVAEQVVDGRGELGGALVAVADHRGDPARVGDARAEHAPRLLRQRARHDARRVRRVAEHGGRLAAGDRAHGRDHPAVVLVVVAGVEDVVLAAVDVLHRDVDPPEAACGARRTPARRRGRGRRRSRPTPRRPRRGRRRRASRARRAAARGRRRRRRAWSRRCASSPAARRARRRARRPAPRRPRARARRRSSGRTARRARPRARPRRRASARGAGRRRGRSPRSAR